LSAPVASPAACLGFRTQDLGIQGALLPLLQPVYGF
jgi:hypothetical protein